MESNFDTVRWIHLPGWWNDLPKGDVRRLMAAIEGNLQRTGGLGQSDTIGYIRQLAISGDSRAIPVLRKALRHDRLSVRIDAALALHALGEPDAVIALIHDYEHCPIDETDFHILKALECIRDPRAIAVVANHRTATESLTATREASDKEKSGCFVVTAACGDPLAPEVIELSAFRDDVLLRKGIGKGFVHLYYRVSPPFAAVIARSAMLRRLSMALIVSPAAKLLATSIRRNREDGG